MRCISGIYGMYIVLKAFLQFRELWLCPIYSEEREGTMTMIFDWLWTLKFLLLPLGNSVSDSKVKEIRLLTTSTRRIIL